MEEKILYLPLKKKWYEMIESGEKPEEYREDKPYWRRRLYKDGDWTTGEFKDFTHVVFTYGYTRRRMKWQIKKILKKFGNPAWGAPTDKMVLTIVLGERVKGCTYYTWKTYQKFETKSALDRFVQEMLQDDKCIED